MCFHLLFAHASLLRSCISPRLSRGWLPYDRHEIVERVFFFCITCTGCAAICMDAAHAVYVVPPTSICY